MIAAADRLSARYRSLFPPTAVLAGSSVFGLMSERPRAARGRSRPVAGFAGCWIDPWPRSCRPVSIPTIPRQCGCCVDADGRALSSILGRSQQLYAAPNGEHLLVGVGITAPAWTWDLAIQCKGFGLIVGGNPREFSDSLALPLDIEVHVTWPRRRRATAAAA